MLADIYAQFVNPGDWCFDVGANGGLQTEILIGLGANVVAIEPDPHHIKVLFDKFKENFQVVIIPEAVGAQEGTDTLWLNGGFSTFSEKWRTEMFPNYPHHPWGETAEVSITTLDILIARLGMPQFCKIDVEGYEYQVLQGLSHPIPVISYEYTGKFVDDAIRCADYLSALGSVEFNCTAGDMSADDLCSPQWFSKSLLHDKLTTYNWGDVYVRFT